MYLHFIRKNTRSTDPNSKVAKVGHPAILSKTDQTAIYQLASCVSAVLTNRTDRNTAETTDNIFMEYQ